MKLSKRPRKKLGRNPRKADSSKATGSPKSRKSGAPKSKKGGQPGPSKASGYARSRPGARPSPAGEDAPPSPPQLKRRGPVSTSEAPERRRARTIDYDETPLALTPASPPDPSPAPPALTPASGPRSKRAAARSRAADALTTPPPAPYQDPLAAAPLFAICGRPNVGKSTLFNKLTESRRSIVGDEPGITRDRIYGAVHWNGHLARIVDTGGIVPDDDALIPSEIYRQASFALDESDCIVMVVDGRSELASPDYDLARQLLRSGKPLVLAVNKIDTEAMAAAAENYRTLGFKTIVPVSAEHSIGIGDLLDEVFAHLKFPEIAANSDKSQLNDGQIPKAAALLDENDLDDLADLADDLDEDDLDELRNEDTGPQHVAPEEEDPEAEDPEAEKKESRQTLNPGTPSTRSMNPGTPSTRSMSPGTPSTRSMSPGTPSTRSMSPGSPSTDSMNPGAPFMRSMSGKATPPTAPPKAETNPGAPEQTNPEQTNPEEEPHPKGLHRTHGEFELHETKVAIIGRPNVGKSTLLNALTGTTRAIVSPIAGTTRDAVDELITYEGARLRIIDTAGIRRKGKTTQMAEKLSVVMARRHLEAADVALLMIDAVEGVTAADATIGGYAHESGRSVIIVINKWDLVTTSRTDGKPPADRRVYEEQLRGALKYLSYAPIVFISASEGRNLGRVLQLIKTVAAARRKRVTTGQMNRFLERVDFQRASVPMAKKLRIYYMTQAAVAPPTFVLFANRAIKLHFSFERFLENQIREHFGFEGTPIWFKVKARNEKTKD